LASDHQLLVGRKPSTTRSASKPRDKGIKSEVAGRAQILVVSDLEAGNMRVGTSRMKTCLIRRAVRKPVLRVPRAGAAVRRRMRASARK
jgi:hypothetical protein